MLGNISTMRSPVLENFLWNGTVTSISSWGHRKLVCSKFQKACSRKAKERRRAQYPARPLPFSAALNVTKAHLENIYVWLTLHAKVHDASPADQMGPFIFRFTKNKIKVEPVSSRGKKTDSSHAGPWTAPSSVGSNDPGLLSDTG